jgi:hypothetical protein
MAIASHPSGNDGWQNPEDAHPDGAHVDWLHDTRFDYVAPRSGMVTWVPLLIKLRDDAMTAAQFARYAWTGDADEARTWIRIPAMYQAPPTNLESNRFLTAMVTPEFFTRKQGDAELQQAIERYEIGASYLEPITSSSPVVMPLVEGPAKHVLVGVIDDGFAFAHERFRRSDGSSRMAFLWDQDGASMPGPLGYGTEIDDGAIDNAIGDGLDEDRIYRRFFLDYAQTGFKPLGRRFSHGTVALDLVCGREAARIPAGRRLPIVAVKLPNRITENPADLDLTMWVADALYYILWRADDISRQDQCAALPVVVNMSYATTHGPHNGQSLLEQTIDTWVTMRAGGPNGVPTTIVLPTGNAYLSRVHAEVRLTGSRPTASLAWRVLPDGNASSWAYLYIDPDAPGAPPVVRFTLTDPWGRTSTTIGVGQKTRLLIDGRPVAELIYEPPVAGNYHKISFWIAPTASFDAATATAPPGTWTIGMQRLGGRCDIHGWIRRGESPPGHPRAGRQSRFDDPAYVVFDAVSGRVVEHDNASRVQRAGSLSAIATGVEPIVVGGACRVSRFGPGARFVAARYSGAGPVEGLRAGPDPDVVAPTEDGVTLHGVLGVGSRSGSVVPTNGTSVAAPQVARLAWRILLRRELLTRARIQSEAAPMPGVSIDRAGAGCIARAPVAPGGRVSR